MKYRKLRVGEIIRHGDEFLSNYCHRWVSDTIDVGNKVKAWHVQYRRPLKSKVAASSTSSNKSYKSALISFRKIDSMRISNAEKISRIAKLLLGLHPPKHADVV